MREEKQGEASQESGADDWSEGEREPKEGASHEEQNCKEDQNGKEAQTKGWAKAAPTTEAD